MPDQEKFGFVRTRYGIVDLLAQRIDKDGRKLWMVSPRTVASLPALSGTVVASPLDRILPELLRDYFVEGAPVGHWLAIVVLGALCYAATWLVTVVVWLVFVRQRAGTPPSRLRRAIEVSARPARILLTSWTLWITAVYVGASIIARQRLAVAVELTGWIALAWIAWRVVDALAGFAIDRMTLRGRMSILSAVTFTRRAAKTAIVAFGLIAALDAMGFNITAGLAALGIGGIAIALGAQKTIEHLVGSLTLVTDQPIRVGDFCRFGSTLGTVEDIGMRSTRIRTQDRTLVTVPNGQLAAAEIENFSRRDKFWFHPVVELRGDSTADQIRTALMALRERIAGHGDVEADGVKIRLTTITAQSFRIEISAYVFAVDGDRFLDVQEELLLGVVEAVQGSGAGFASTVSADLVQQLAASRVHHVDLQRLPAPPTAGKLVTVPA